MEEAARVEVGHALGDVDGQRHAHRPRQARARDQLLQRPAADVLNTESNIFKSEDIFVNAHAEK